MTDLTRSDTVCFTAVAIWHQYGIDKGLICSWSFWLLTDSFHVLDRPIQVITNPNNDIKNLLRLCSAVPDKENVFALNVQ